MWTKVSTKLLIHEYEELKEDFRDPKIKKRTLWNKIKKRFEENGYGMVTEDILDRKWRNLKKTYTLIKDNNKKTGRARNSWEYYDDFNNIYLPDKTINLPQIASSPLVCPEIIEPEKHVEIEYATNLRSPSPLTISSGKSTPTEKKTPSRSSGTYYLKKRQAEIEERRIEEIKLLRLALEKNNEIQSERNEILKKFLTR